MLSVVVTLLFIYMSVLKYNYISMLQGDYSTQSHPSISANYERSRRKYAMATLQSAAQEDLVCSLVRHLYRASLDKNSWMTYNRSANQQ